MIINWEQSELKLEDVDLGSLGFGLWGNLDVADELHGLFEFCLLHSEPLAEEIKGVEGWVLVVQEHHSCNGVHGNAVLPLLSSDQFGLR